MHVCVLFPTRNLMVFWQKENTNRLSECRCRTFNKLFAVEISVFYISWRRPAEVCSCSSDTTCFQNARANRPVINDVQLE